MKGEKLINILIEASGLPSEFAEKEINKLIEKENLKKDSLTIEQLRPVMAKLLQQVILEAKEAY